MAIETLPEFDAHELVRSFYDPETGLRNIIAIHNTDLGPAVGGTRYLQYSSEEEALRDALRLSRAMTYKCALAGVPFGGGKSVIIATGAKSSALLQAYARNLNGLGRQFFTGEDVGITQDDVDILAKKSKFIIGGLHRAGDPSPWAALGVFVSIKSALKAVFGRDDLQGRTIAIKGLGKVGGELARLLTAGGAKIIGADIDPEVLKAAKSEFPDIALVDPLEIHRQAADVYSPCALGNDLTLRNVLELRCAIVCGSANNQLASSDVGEELYRRNIVYVPDYVANSGGLINVVDELYPTGYQRVRVASRVQEIGRTVAQILSDSRRKGLSPGAIADLMARGILAAASRQVHV